MAVAVAVFVEAALRFGEFGVDLDVISVWTETVVGGGLEFAAGSDVKAFVSLDEYRSAVGLTEAEI